MSKKAASLRGGLFEKPDPERLETSPESEEQ